MVEANKKIRGYSIFALNSAEKKLNIIWMGPATSYNDAHKAMVSERKEHALEVDKYIDSSDWYIGAIIMENDPQIPGEVEQFIALLEAANVPKEEYDKWTKSLLEILQELQKTFTCIKKKT